MPTEDQTEGHAAGETWTLADEVERLADRWAGRPAFFFEGRTVSYDEMEARANRYARWGRSRGLKRGDVVALFMQNRPDFVIAWFGMAKIGVTTALINAQLTGAALAHCVAVAKARLAIVGEELSEAWRSAAPLVGGDIGAWLVGDGRVVQSPGDGLRNLDAALAEQPGVRMSVAEARPDLTPQDPLIYVYTSGTTGLPKAVRLTGARILHYYEGAAKGAQPGERSYVVLPLYHSTGGFLGVAWGLTAGGGVVVRRKFSVSQFWSDVVAHQVTSFFYVGEICRYLVEAPVHPQESERRLDLVMGAGMREDVWRRFAERFRPVRIVEFYGSTEGAATMSNADGKIGSIGRAPPGSEPKLRLVCIDPDTHEPLRRDGLCIEAGVDEPGEAIGRVIPGDAMTFSGYAGNAAASEAKMLRDVFAQGDCWYRSGDLLRKDAEGYFYFMDRLGDTFRWKGENVATEEVAAVLAEVPCVEGVAVYGVKVADRDGRAGMAAIIAKGALDLGAVGAAVKQLPAYARPIFLRVVDSFATTGTFKIQKTGLMQQGFDPAQTGAAVYYLDPRSGAYVPLTPDLHLAIVTGALRL